MAFSAAEMIFLCVNVMHALLVDHNVGSVVPGSPCRAGSMGNPLSYLSHSTATQHNTDGVPLIAASLMTLLMLLSNVLCHNSGGQINNAH